MKIIKANEEWYEALVEECKAIITEAGFNSRWALVEGYHKLGERIDEEVRQRPISLIQLFQDLGKSITNCSRSTFYYAHQTYKKFPDIQQLPEGKNISWNKLITKYLPSHREEQIKDFIYKDLPENLQIIHGDFRKQDIKENSIDCIITDPPYPEEFLPLWGELSLFASKVLKPSGFCITYSGELHLPKVIELMNKHLIYYWTFALYHTGHTQLILSRNLIARWKPILIYQKPPFKKLNYVIQDYIVSEQPEKEEHEWQQSESGVKKLITKFTKENDLICDPFSGAGTFPKVAHEFKRRAIGIEIDEISYKLSLKRIYDTTRTNK